jgi:cell division septum initiation protein DivIVA
MNDRRRRPLTAHEIRNLQIRRIGLRKGYDPNAVHELLQRLSDEVASRDRTISDLTSRLTRAENEAYARRHGTLPAAADEGQITDLLAEIDVRLKAQQYADEVIASAQHGAAQIVRQGRHQASQILGDAHKAAEQAAHAYRQRAGADYNPDKEELARLLALAQWAQAQLGGLHQQMTATNTTVARELSSIGERLRPILDPNGDNGGAVAGGHDAAHRGADANQPAGYGAAAGNSAGYGAAAGNSAGYGAAAGDPAGQGGGGGAPAAPGGGAPGAGRGGRGAPAPGRGVGPPTSPARAACG